MLTDVKIKNSKPQAKPYKLTDSHGLYIEIKPTGIKAFRYRYRIAGKENLFAIGNYPETSLSEARKERDKARDLAKEGIHPSRQRRLDKLIAEKNLGDTFEGAAVEWLARNEPDWSKGYHSKVQSLLRSDIFPWIGKLSVSEVKAPHILDVLKRIEKRSPVMAKLAQTWIGGVFRFAVAHGKRDDDPTWPLRRAVKATQVQHHAKLMGAKAIGDFLRSIDSATGDYQTKAATALIWLTATRIEEAVGARWSEFDFGAGIWVIPPARMKVKTNGAHVIPLSTQAVAVLESIRPISGTLDHLFPHRSDRKREMSGASVRTLFQRAGYKDKFTPHGVRGTFSTAANEARFDKDVIELCLAHKEADRVRAAYNDALLISTGSIPRPLGRKAG